MPWICKQVQKMDGHLCEMQKSHFNSSDEWDLYRSDAMNYDISDFDPAFEGQDFKQSQHSIPHIVKVKVPRIGP